MQFIARDRLLLCPVFRQGESPELDYLDTANFTTGQSRVLSISIPSGVSRGIESKPYLPRYAGSIVETDIVIDLNTASRLSDDILSNLSQARGEMILPILKHILNETLTLGVGENYPPDIVDRIQKTIDARSKAIEALETDFAQSTGVFAGLPKPGIAGVWEATQSLLSVIGTILSVGGVGALASVGWLARLVPLTSSLTVAAGLAANIVIDAAVEKVATEADKPILAGQSRGIAVVFNRLYGWMRPWKSQVVSGMISVSLVAGVKAGFVVWDRMQTERPFSDADRVASSNIDEFIEGNRFISEIQYTTRVFAMLDAFERNTGNSAGGGLESFAKTWAMVRNLFTLAFGGSDYPSADFDAGISVDETNGVWDHIILYANLANRVFVLVPDVGVFFTRVGSEQLAAPYMWARTFDAVRVHQKAFNNLLALLVSKECIVILQPLMRYRGADSAACKPSNRVIDTSGRAVVVSNGVNQYVNGDSIVLDWSQAKLNAGSVPLSNDLLVPAIAETENVSTFSAEVLEFLAIRAIGKFLPDPAVNRTMRNTLSPTSRVFYAGDKTENMWNKCYTGYPNYTDGYTIDDMYMSLVIDLEDAALPISRKTAFAYLKDVCTQAQDGNRLFFAPKMWGIGQFAAGIGVKRLETIQRVQAFSNDARMQRPEPYGGTMSKLARVLDVKGNIDGYKYIHSMRSMPMQAYVFCIVPNYMVPVVEEYGVMSFNSMVALRYQSPTIMHALHCVISDIVAWVPRVFGECSTYREFVGVLARFMTTNGVPFFTHGEYSLLQQFAEIASKGNDAVERFNTPGIPGSFAMKHDGFTVYRVNFNVALEYAAQNFYSVDGTLGGEINLQTPRSFSDKEIELLKYSYVMNSILTSNVQSLRGSGNVSAIDWQIWPDANRVYPAGISHGVWPAIALPTGLIPRSMLYRVQGTATTKRVPRRRLAYRKTPT